MATLATQQIVITVSRLVRDKEKGFALTPDQVEMLVDSLPTLVEELVQDPKLVIEASVDS